MIRRIMRLAYPFYLNSGPKSLRPFLLKKISLFHLFNFFIVKVVNIICIKLWFESSSDFSTVCFNDGLKIFAKNQFMFIWIPTSAMFRVSLVNIVLLSLSLHLKLSPGSILPNSKSKVLPRKYQLLLSKGFTFRYIWS